MISLVCGLQNAGVDRAETIGRLISKAFEVSKEGMEAPIFSSFFQNPIVATGKK